MDDVGEKISAAMRANVRAAVNTIVADVEDDLRRTCNVPVGFARGRVVRSKPGEAPRRETGDYRNGFDHFVEDRGSFVHGEAGHPSDLAIWLEAGTSRMAPRPHFQSVYNRLLPVVQQRFTEALNQQ